MSVQTGAPSIDPRKVEALAMTAFNALGGAVVSGMIYLGDQLGLYRALSASGPVTSEALATRTGLNERWVREWLRGQAAAGLIENDGEKFSLSPEGHLVLVDESTPASAIGAFEAYPQAFNVLDKLPQAFKSGVGLPYDDVGPGLASQIERMMAPW